MTRTAFQAAMTGTRGRAGSSLAVVLAIIVGVMLAIAPLSSAASHAAPAKTSPASSGPMTLEVHKYEQPVTAGDPATGLPLDPAVLPATEPVPGATFTATRVPGIDPLTNAGQRAAAALTPGEAAERIAGAAPNASATTDGAGNATLDGLPAGLYVVHETVTPPGYIGAAAFLVTLPLTNPETRDGWLTTVHVYPKNAQAGIALDVFDADAITLGDTVTWRATADIPQQRAIDGYRVIMLFADEVRLDRLGDIDVAFDGSTTQLVRGVDYELVEHTAADGRWGVAVDFTASGRTKLTDAIAEDPAARVQITAPTWVASDGALTTEAILLASRSQIDDYEAGRAAGVNDTAETRWGPLGILVTERGNPERTIPGAVFKLYLSPEDALAGRNAIEVSGVSEWRSDADGRVHINGLRLSDFVNGLDRADDDPLFRRYYVMLTEIPEGWSGERTPLGVIVDSTEEERVVVVELYRGGDDAGANSQANADASGDASGGSGDSGGLPVTGGQILGILILGILLFGGGAALIIAKRRSGPAEAEKEEDAIIDREQAGDE